MIRFENVSFGFPQKDLYEDISFEIEQGDHAVLIGSNGCGKSSLIRLMMDKDNFTYEGRIVIEEGVRIGYVSQFVSHEREELTAYDFLAAPFQKMLADFDGICARMADENEDADKLNISYQKLMDEIEAVDGYNYDANIRKALAKADLTFLTDSMVSNISGGEYKLLYILRSMLLKPQLLIMDEPDVFLDFENLVSLTRMINDYDGTLLAITHSRILLNCADKSSGNPSFRSNRELSDIHELGSSLRINDALSGLVLNDVVSDRAVRMSIKYHINSSSIGYDISRPVWNRFLIKSEMSHDHDIFRTLGPDFIDIFLRGLVELFSSVKLVDISSVLLEIPRSRLYYAFRSRETDECDLGSAEVNNLIRLQSCELVAALSRIVDVSSKILELRLSDDLRKLISAIVKLMVSENGQIISGIVHYIRDILTLGNRSGILDEFHV